MVAAGKGQRMKRSIPKQFISVAGKPILVHAMEKFLLFDPGIEIVLVLNQDFVSMWEEIQQKYLPNVKISVSYGGKERYHSVSSGLDSIKKSEIVAIHDAVRPCVNIETIRRTFESAEKHGSGIPVMPLKDSIRKIDGESSKVVDRSQFRIVQTPQTFNTKLIREAYKGPIAETVTDDATVFESCHGEVHLVEGDYNNLKVTTQEDLFFAETLLNKNSPSS